MEGPGGGGGGGGAGDGRGEGEEEQQVLQVRRPEGLQVVLQVKLHSKKQNNKQYFCTFCFRPILFNMSIKDVQEWQTGRLRGFLHGDCGEGSGGETACTCNTVSAVHAAAPALAPAPTGADPWGSAGPFGKQTD